MKKKIIIFGSIIIILISLITVYFIKNSTSDEKKDIKNIVATEPEFIKQGSLSFYKSDDNQLIKTVDIEIANNEYSREKGLMYRRNMNESQGMLFVFEDATPRFFWMKNTYISLDIIYIGSDKKVVSIQKSAIPLSEESLPSYQDAMYVVEVIAGFTDKYGIKTGDSISF